MLTPKGAGLGSTLRFFFQNPAGPEGSGYSKAPADPQDHTDPADPVVPEDPGDPEDHEDPGDPEDPEDPKGSQDRKGLQDPQLPADAEDSKPEGSADPEDAEAHRHPQDPGCGKVVGNVPGNPRTSGKKPPKEAQNADQYGRMPLTRTIPPPLGSTTPLVDRNLPPFVVNTKAGES